MRHQTKPFLIFALGLCALGGAVPGWAAFSYPGCTDVAQTEFRDVKLVARTDGINEPLKMALDDDGAGNVDVYWVERMGLVKLFVGATKAIKQIGTLPADTKFESGLSGVALD